MPRSKPTQTIEHRISLSDFERKELKELLDAQTKSTEIQNYIDGGKGILFAGSAFAIGYIGYLALVEIFELKDEVTGAIKNIVYGKPTYPTKNVPENEAEWVNRDPDTGERINPMNPVPIAGGLVGLGMQIGEAIPVGTYVAQGWNSFTSIFD